MRKSLVLLKNGKSASAGPVLPLAKKVPKILVAGTHADNLGNQCGGWTIEWQGLNGNNLTAGTYSLLVQYITRYNFFFYKSYQLFPLACGFRCVLVDSCVCN